MFLNNYVFFSFCLIVFFIYAFNVRLSNCHDANAGMRDKRNAQGPGGSAPGGPGPGGSAPGAPGPGGLGGYKASNIFEELDTSIEVLPMPFITVSVPLQFEGMDYDLLKNLSQKIYDNYYDCFYFHTKCIRDLTYFHTVCAYDSSLFFVNFSNKCQLELENCRHRVRNETWKKYEGIYGNYERDPWDISAGLWHFIHFYHGDGYSCQYFWFRRQMVNLYIEDEQEDFDQEG